MHQIRLLLSDYSQLLDFYGLENGSGNKHTANPVTLVSDPWDPDGGGGGGGVFRSMDWFCSGAFCRESLHAVGSRLCLLSLSWANPFLVFLPHTMSISTIHINTRIQRLQAEYLMWCHPPDQLIHCQFAGCQQKCQKQKCLTKLGSYRFWDLSSPFVRVCVCVNCSIKCKHQLIPNHWRRNVLTVSYQVSADFASWDHPTAGETPANVSSWRNTRQDHQQC